MKTNSRGKHIKAKARLHLLSKKAKKRKKRTLLAKLINGELKPSRLQASREIFKSCSVGIPWKMKSLMLLLRNKLTSKLLKRINTIWWMRLRGFQSYVSRFVGVKMTSITSHLVTAKLLIWSKNCLSWEKKSKSLTHTTRVPTTWTTPRLNSKAWVVGTLTLLWWWTRTSLSTTSSKAPWAHSSRRAYSFARWKNPWINTSVRNKGHLQPVPSPSSTKKTSWMSELEWIWLITMVNLHNCQSRSWTNSLMLLIMMTSMK